MERPISSVLPIVSSLVYTWECATVRLNTHLLQLTAVYTPSRKLCETFGSKYIYKLSDKYTPYEDFDHARRVYAS